MAYVTFLGKMERDGLRLTQANLRPVSQLKHRLYPAGSMSDGGNLFLHAGRQIGNGNICSALLALQRVHKQKVRHRFTSEAAQRSN
jgi:hypothetical protein